MTDKTRSPERIAAQIALFERLAEQPDEDLEALGAEIAPGRYDTIHERVFATLEADEAAAVARGEAPSFIPEREETRPMTTTPETEAGSAGEEITRVVRDGVTMLRFAVSLLRQGPEAIEAARLRFRRSEGAPEDLMPWRPRHLGFEGNELTGYGTLWLDYIELKASPDAPPEIAVRVDGRHLAEEDVTVDYAAEDRQISVSLYLDAEPFYIALPENDEDRVLVDIETAP